MNIYFQYLLIPFPSIQRQGKILLNLVIPLGLLPDSRGMANQQHTLGLVEVGGNVTLP